MSWDRLGWERANRSLFRSWLLSINKVEQVRVSHEKATEVKRTARATAGAEATVRLGVIERALDEAWFNGDQFYYVRVKIERANRFCSNNGWPRVDHERDITIVCSCISLVHVTYTGGVYMHMHLYVQL